MNTFDRSKHPAGTDGRFVTRTASDPEVSLGSPAVPGEELVHPSGCAICGGLQGSHGLTSKGGHGNHHWQAPSPEQRKERITAAADARKAAVAEGRKGFHFDPPVR